MKRLALIGLVGWATFGSVASAAVLSVQGAHNAVNHFNRVHYHASPDTMFATRFHRNSARTITVRVCMDYGTTVEGQSTTYDRYCWHERVHQLSSGTIGVHDLDPVG